MLVRLLYASHATEPLAPETIDAILASSRKRNPTLGITGLLCHSGDTFMQVLEGGREAVNQLYTRICQDLRHRDVILLHYEEIAERRFAGWTMGQVNLSRLNPALVLKYSASARLDPYAMSGAALAALLEELVSAGVIECA